MRVAKYWLVIYRFWSPKSSISSISGHFSGITENRSSLTSPWMTISSSPVTDDPQANFVPKYFAATFKSISAKWVSCWNKKNDHRTKRITQHTKCTQSGHNSHWLLFSSWRSWNAYLLRSIIFTLFRLHYSLTTTLLTLLVIIRSTTVCVIQFNFGEFCG